MNNQSTDEVVVYEHTGLRVPRHLETVYRDTAPQFGWDIDAVETGAGISGHSTLRLKRDRRLRNRPMTLELERANRSALTAIDALERSRTSIPRTIAITIGIIGSAFLAGSIFLLEGDFLVASIALGTIGLLGWLAGWFSFNKSKSARAPKVDAAIDRQYDIVYDTAQRAAALLR